MSNLTLWAASSASLADVASCFLFQVSISVSRRLASSSRPPAASLRGTGSSPSSLSGGRAGGALVVLEAGALAWVASPGTRPVVGAAGFGSPRSRRTRASRSAICCSSRWIRVSSSLGEVGPPSRTSAASAGATSRQPIRRRPAPPATMVDRIRRAAGSPGRNTGDVLWTDLPETFPVEEGDPLHLSLAAPDFVHRPPMTVALGADQPLEERLEGVRVLRTQGRQEGDLPP